MKRCKNCGKELPDDSMTYCCRDCGYAYNSEVYKIKSRIQTIARKYNFRLENEDKIINAKIRFFNGDDTNRCPCDGNNPERFCGSALCIHDVVADGHCHCRLFWKN